MKIRASSRSRRAGKSKPRFSALAGTHTYPLSQAKTFLGRLIEKAARGETVYIVRGAHRFLLQPLPEIEPIPARPAGYFAHCYDREEIELENRLAEASVVEKPADLE